MWFWQTAVAQFSESYGAIKEASMLAIAMPREMGSLGKDVAAGLGDQLGLKVVHHELVANLLL